MINTKLLEAWCLGAESISAEGPVGDSKLLATEIRILLSELDSALEFESAFFNCQQDIYHTKRKLELAIVALKGVAEASKGVLPNRKLEYIHKLARQGLREIV